MREIHSRSFNLMSFFGDFHIHSRFARACSKDITLEKLEHYARMKGLQVIGTGDFQHPLWFKDIASQLTDDGQGILRSKTGFPFVWQTEISLAYTHHGKGRRVHHLVLAPNKDVVLQIIDFLKSKGRLDYDGRPIFGISSVEFVERLMEISHDIEVIPSHAWTPFFGVLGSKSGYDSVELCFEEKSKYIHAIETGMSSDILMNRRISKLDRYNLVSFSDIHSYWPWRFGREATRFDCELTYQGILHAIRTGEGLKGTIETPPAYGKYHVDGHRACGITLEPSETKKINGICPKCKQPLTIGVAYRVEQLADRKEPTNVPPFVSLIPLTELISAVYGISLLSSKKVWGVYNTLIKEFGNEYAILLDASLESLQKIVDEKLAKVILLNREGKLKIIPGYDGVYGKIILEQEQIVKSPTKQKSLGEF